MVKTVLSKVLNGQMMYFRYVDEHDMLVATHEPSLAAPADDLMAEVFHGWELVDVHY